ncbi:hypothetical protein XELAEV_18045314mg [Xenopus laevis]|uniref:SCAN box domain-containing protein n=1 Tax=Xenopus laevis TaxID=8355 RepID=A0A974C0J6_XENLA|nr:hypothetical protein XELAEV_18045314mg [Xenopus laevis]
MSVHARHWHLEQAAFGIMSTTDSNSATDKMAISGAEEVAETKQQAAQPPSERPQERDAGSAIAWQEAPEPAQNKNNASLPLGSRNIAVPICPDNAPQIPKLDCHQTADIGPLLQVRLLINELVHTHTAILGSEATILQSEMFLRLQKDVFKSAGQAQNQWHKRLIEDPQHNRKATLEMAQMQLCYSKSGSLSPPFSDDHFPQFQDVSEDIDCVMHNVPEPESVFFQPDTMKNKAIGCYCDVSVGACSDYTIIKEALLKPYGAEPEIHRVRFRTMARKTEESFTSFNQRLQYRYERWMNTSNIKEFKDCYKPLVLEQLLKKCPAEVRQKILNEKGCTPYQAAKIADEIMHLHQETAFQPRLKKCPPPPKIDGKIDEFLQYFVAHKDNILDLLDLFECRCMLRNLPKSRWVQYLCRKLKWKVLDMCLSENKYDYEFIKAKILRTYAITPESHWKKFRTIQRPADQTFTVFYHHLLSHYNRWMEAYEVKTFGQCTDLMVAEQLLTQCPPEVRSMITKQRGLNPEAVARIAEEHLNLSKSAKESKSRRSMSRRFTESRPSQCKQSHKKDSLQA